MPRTGSRGITKTTKAGLSAKSGELAAPVLGGRRLAFTLAGPPVSPPENIHSQGVTKEYS